MTLIKDSREAYCLFFFKVVITTYQTLCGDFPKRKKKNAPVEEGEDDWDPDTP